MDLYEHAGGTGSPHPPGAEGFAKRPVNGDYSFINAIVIPRSCDFCVRAFTGFISQSRIRVDIDTILHPRECGDAPELSPARAETREGEGGATASKLS